MHGFGFYAMHGNARAWVEDDWHGDYNGAPDDGTAWISGPRGSGRVFRGGCWINDARGCRSAFRYGYEPDVRYFNLGFRLSRSITLDP